LNFIEEFILFIFALLAMLTINSKYSFGQELQCAHQVLPNINAKYLFVGEDHRDFKSKNFIATYSSEFKRMGFDTIFVEYIESKDQRILDKYYIEPQSTRENVFRTYGQQGDWGYDPLAYLFLTDVLSQNNFHIYGLDRRSDLRINMNADVKMALRDLHMFNVASEFIKKNPDKKVVFLNGASHSFINPKLSGPSFFEHFVNVFKNESVQNLKVDYYWNDSITPERLYLSKKTTLPNCDFDFLIYKPTQSKFNYYLFENTKEILP
jgi:hypothetical protein